ncbi:MAG: Gfo/Idh/MocA family oxidoreductase [Nitrosopumilaceae archaeon]|nr:Gfo/Idh/MocA family oxidoreductase [Nitrosopumilaceae archaeon]
MRIVQIGAGGWGKNHLRVLSGLGVLGAVCDSDPSRCAEYGRRYGIKCYTSLDDMMNSEEFDGAFVVTPTSTHAAITERLLEAGKHVFVEKPLTYSAQEGASLARLALKKGLVLTCGYIERFNPAVETVKKMTDDGRYGKLMMLELRRENRMPLHIKDVGIIYDTSVHDIDTANWLFGDMPQIVFARAGRMKHDHEDYASIMLGYPGDRIAVITSNWITPERVRRFDAVFADAVVSSDFITQEVTVHGADGASTESGDGREPLLLEIQSFLGAMRGSHRHRVAPDEAVGVTTIAEAALRSSREGVPVRLDTD